MSENKIHLFLKTILGPPIDEYGAYSFILALKCLKEMDNSDDLANLEKYIIQELEGKFDLNDLVDILVDTGISKTVEKILIKIGSDQYSTGFGNILQRTKLRPSIEALNEKEHDRLEEVFGIDKTSKFCHSKEEVDEKIRRLLSDVTSSRGTESASRIKERIQLLNPEILIKIAEAVLDSKKIKQSSKFRQPERDVDGKVREKLTKSLSIIGSNGAVAVLGKALRDPDRMVRSSAVEALYRVGSDRATDELGEALGHIHRDVCNESAEALCKIGSDRAVHALVGRILEYNKQKSTIVADATKLAETFEKNDTKRTADDSGISLKDFDSLATPKNREKHSLKLPSEADFDRALYVLINTLRDARGPFDSYHSEMVLGMIASDTSIDALVEAIRIGDGLVAKENSAGGIAGIYEEMKDPYRSTLSVRNSSANTLCKIGSEKAVDALIKLLGDHDTEVRCTSARALGRLGSEKPLGALIRLLINNEDQVRRTAAEALSKIGTIKAVEALIELLSFDNDDVRCISVEALGNTGSFKSENALIDLLKNDTDSVRIKAAEALGKIGSHKAEDALIDLLKNDTNSVRVKAAEALGKIGSHKAEDALIKLLDNENEVVCSKAAEALCKMGQVKDLLSVYKALKNSVWSSRKDLTDILCKSDSDFAEDALIELLEDDEDLVRCKAAETLGKIKSEKAANSLIKCLVDFDEKVRRKSAKALGRINPKMAVDVLVKLMEDDNDVSRSLAVDALGIIGTDDAVNALIKKLKDDPVACYYSAYSLALGNTGTDKAIDALFTLWKMTVGIKKRFLTDAIIQVENHFKILSYFNNRDFDDFFRKYALKTQTPFYTKLGKWFCFDQKLHQETAISSTDIKPD